MDSRARISIILTLTLFLAFIFLQTEASGKDLGVWGKLYEIREPDMLSHIKSKTRRIDIEALRQEITSRIEKTHHALSSVSLNVPTATEQRVRYVDPSVKITSPIYDLSGKEMFSAGMVNPLDYVSLSKDILVLREDQIQTTLAEMSGEKKNLILILTDGNIQRSSLQAGQIVYRANRFILQRLQIEKVPALVTQDRQKLRVQEIVVK